MLCLIKQNLGLQAALDSGYTSSVKVSDGGCQALLTAPTSVAECNHCWRCGLCAGRRRQQTAPGWRTCFHVRSAGSLGRSTWAPWDCCLSAFQLTILAALSDLARISFFTGPAKRAIDFWLLLLVVAGILLGRAFLRQQGQPVFP